MEGGGGVGGGFYACPSETSMCSDLHCLALPLIRRAGVGLGLGFMLVYPKQGLALTCIVWG